MWPWRKKKKTDGIQVKNRRFGARGEIWWNLLGLLLQKYLWHLSLGSVPRKLFLVKIYLVFWICPKKCTAKWNLTASFKAYIVMELEVWSMERCADWTRLRTGSKIEGVEWQKTKDRMRECLWRQFCGCMLPYSTAPISTIKSPQNLVSICIPQLISSFLDENWQEAKLPTKMYSAFFFNLLHFSSSHPCLACLKFIFSFPFQVSIYSTYLFQPNPKPISLRPKRGRDNGLQFPALLQSLFQSFTHGRQTVNDDLLWQLLRVSGTARWVFMLSLGSSYKHSTWLPWNKFIICLLIIH